MFEITIKQLLEAGVHFGHPTKKWNPKMSEYIFTQRNGIHIVDLQKTVKKFEEAYNFVSELAQEGGTLLFIGTKKQAADTIKEEAERCGLYYVNARWPGGMLTNFNTIRKSIKRLKELEKMQADGTFNLLPKKEVAKKMKEIEDLEKMQADGTFDLLPKKEVAKKLKEIEDLEKMQADGTFDLLPKKEVAKKLKEIEDLEKSYGGIKEMDRLPSAVFIVDTRKEANAVKEAKKLGIPVVAIVDTNCDPEDADYIIPGNDDAIRAIKLISAALADAVIEARGGVQETLPEETEAVAEEAAQDAE